MALWAEARPGLSTQIVANYQIVTSRKPGRLEWRYVGEGTGFVFTYTRIGLDACPPHPHLSMHLQVFPALCAIVTLCVLLVPTMVVAQPFHYARDCLTNVDNATLHVSPSNTLILPDGNPVAPGDTIAVYTAEGDCAGYGVWQSGEGVTLSASGRDTINPSSGGYADGEPLKVEVYDVSHGATVDVGTSLVFDSCGDSILPICRDDGIYASNTIHQIEAFGDSTSTITRSITTEDGWNLVSVPVQVENPAFGTVFPACTTGFIFEPGTGYQPVDEEESIPVGRGVFAQCQTDTTTVTGPPAPPAVSVGAGWQIIGVFEDTIAVDAVTSAPANLIVSNFFAMSPTEGYESVTTLHPGNAYWVKTAGPGTLHFSGGSGPPPSAVTASRAAGADKEDTRLVFTDARGQRATLAFKGNRGTESPPVELPPTPPADIFSVRLANDQVAAGLPLRTSGNRPSVRSEVLMQGASFPVTVRMQAEQEDQIITLRLDHRNVTLSRSQPAADLSIETQTFSVEATTRPLSFSLGKPRPNPVRVHAQLQYRLPELSEVLIDLYDVLGRRVARLVDQQKQAGTYPLQIDTGSLSSGIYFIRMSAGSFQDTRRIRVVR